MAGSTHRKLSCTPPAISLVAATPSLLAANHKMVPVSVAVDATAACGPPVCTIALPLPAMERIDEAGDIVITGGLTALPPSEVRRLHGSHLHKSWHEVRDTAGECDDGGETVRVPHNQRE